MKVLKKLKKAIRPKKNRVKITYKIQQVQKNALQNCYFFENGG